MRGSAAPRSAAKELKMRGREFASFAIGSAASSQQAPARDARGPGPGRVPRIEERQTAEPCFEVTSRCSF